MDVLITKVITALAMPLGLLVLGLAVLVVVLRRQRVVAGALFALLAAIWTVSTPAFASWIWRAWEAQYPPIPLEQVPQADAAIILGGMLGPSGPDFRQIDMGPAIDRLHLGLRLYRAGKVRRLIVTGGDWLGRKDIPQEADLARNVLEDWGVPREAVLAETASRNTRENAANVKRLLEAQGIGSALLVTSAFHMPRAMRTFSAAGLDVTPVATDHRAGPTGSLTVLDFLPDSSALAGSTVVWKEWVGRQYHSQR